MRLIEPCIKSLFPLFVLFAFGCTFAAKPAPFNGIQHTVRYNGETLGVIAAWYTGSSSSWKVIAAQNPILDPDQLEIGDVLFLPQEILVNQKPLEQNFVRTYWRSKRKRKSVVLAVASSGEMQAQPDPGNRRPMNSTQEQEAGQRHELLSELLSSSP